MDRLMYSGLSILMVAALAFAMLMQVPAMRTGVFGITGIVGFPTYFHQRVAEDIVSGQFNWYDSLSYGGRPYTYPPGFVFTLAGFIWIFGSPVGGYVMMAFLGAAMAALLALMSREFPGTGRSLLIMVFSPLFFFLFTHLSTRSPAILLGLLSLYILIKGRSWVLSGACLAGAALFSPEAAAFSGLVMLLWAMLSRPGAGWTEKLLGATGKKGIGMRNVAKPLLLGIAISMLWYAPFFAANGLPEYNALHSDYAQRGYEMAPMLVQNLFWETGFEGFPVIIMALALLGLWKTEDRFLRVWFIVAIVGSLLIWRLFFYSIFIVPFMASIGMARLKKPLGRLYLPFAAVILVYVVLAGASFAVEFASGYPIQKQVRGMEWIRDNTPPDAVVLSDWTHGHWIAGIANRANFMDGYAEYAPGASERLAGLEGFYRNCTIPEGYGITHIYIEQWIIDNYGASCVDQRFRRVYDSEQIYVYEV